jgi:nucleotide-binding universal stress UspA family protein
LRRSPNLSSPSPLSSEEERHARERHQEDRRRNRFQPARHCGAPLRQQDRRAFAELVVVYADTFEPPAEFTAAQVHHIVETIERSKKRTREQLEAYVAKHVAKSVPWRAVVANGLPATSISTLAQSEGADFIALGTHGRGGLQRLMMGSVAETVIREALVPVLTVRSLELPADIQRVLCPVNASEAAIAAATQAGRIASALGAKLTLLHVSTAADADFDAEALVPERGTDVRILRHAVTDDHPAPEILRIGDSGDYDLIVVGAQHRLVRDVTLFGTTTASVTRHAHTPVLTVTLRSTAVRRESAHVDAVTSR